jgi:hypothetical protein
METSATQHAAGPERVAELQAQASMEGVLAGCCLVTPRGALASFQPRSYNCNAYNEPDVYPV